MLPEFDTPSSAAHDAQRHLLRSDPTFRTLWLGQTISMMGSQITAYALPLLAVLTLHATPSQMGTLRALEYAPAMLIGLVAGVWVDRLRRRPLLIAADLVQAALLVILPLAVALGLLRLGVLDTVVALLSLVSVFSGAAAGAIVPVLIPQDRLIQANSALATSGSTTQIIGPGLAGILVQAMTAPVAVLIDALSFLLSALALGRIHVREANPPPAAQRPSLRAEVGEGLRMVIGTPILRAFVASSATLDVFWNALMAVYFLYITRDLRLPPTAYGLIFGLGSIGALLGSLVAGPVSRRLGLGPAVIVAQFVLGAAGLLIALSVRLPTVALVLLTLAEMVQGGMNTIYGINSQSLTQAMVPDRLRGRVNASRQVLGLVGVTGGALIGGLLGDRVGVPTTVVIGASGGVLAFVWLLLSPLRALRAVPPSEQGDNWSANDD